MNVDRSARWTNVSNAMVQPRRTTRRGRGQRGAVLVELAVMAPLLFTILFGVIEFGWLFSQHLDSRHGAREGARLAAVNYTLSGYTGTAQHATIVAATCQRMDPAGVTKVRLDFVTAGETQVGDRARLEVSVDVETLTGFLDVFLDDTVLTSQVEIRLERDATWTGNANWTTCT